MTLNLPRARAVTLAIGSFLLLMIACTPGEETRQLPEGVQTVTGTLEKTELSLVRRGTHVLVADDEELYFVESPQLSLRDYEGMDVSIKGLIEHNVSDDYLPVLLVQEITLSDVPMMLWNVPAFSMTLSAPEVWSGSVLPDGIRFVWNASQEPVLTVSKTSLTRLPAGTPLIVGNERAVKDLSATGAQLFYVSHDKDIIAFSFMPDEGMSENAFTQLTTRVLRTIQFASSSRAAGTGAVSGTGSSKVVPCGGPNGILCPSGSYCEVTDPVSGIGVCRSLAR